MCRRVMPVWQSAHPAADKVLQPIIVVSVSAALRLLRLCLMPSTDTAAVLVFCSLWAGLWLAAWSGLLGGPAALLGLLQAWEAAASPPQLAPASQEQQPCASQLRLLLSSELSSSWLPT